MSYINLCLNSIEENKNELPSLKILMKIIEGFPSIEIISKSENITAEKQSDPA